MNKISAPQRPEDVRKQKLRKARDNVAHGPVTRTPQERDNLLDMLLQELIKD